MSATTLFSTFTVTDLPVAGASRRPTASRADRLQAWVARKVGRRMVDAERALLRRRWPEGLGEVLTLETLRGTSAGHLARLRGAATASVDTVVSVGALAAAPDVTALMVEAKRVLRAGGRLLFVEPVAAPVGTRRRWLQRVLDRAWRVVAGTANAPRDLWNDLKAARFDRLDYQSVSLPGLGGLPVPHLVGEAVARQAVSSSLRSPGNSGARIAGVAWRAPAFAFFGR